MIHYDYGSTALVVFDMLEAYRGPIEAAGSLAPTARVIEACRRVKVPIFYARADHRADGADFARTMSDTDAQLRPWGRMNPPPTAPRFASGTPESAVLAEIAPQPGDYDVPKHRWSAFHGTHLDLSLRSRGIDTILLVGGSTHVGIAATAFDARDRDLQVTIVADCCHGQDEQRAFFLQKVFPRMCNVRSAGEVIRGLEPQQVVQLAAGHRV
jgi:nicotinamidase-related amidase